MLRGLREDRLIDGKKPLPIREGDKFVRMDWIARFNWDQSISVSDIQVLSFR